MNKLAIITLAIAAISGSQATGGHKYGYKYVKDYGSDYGSDSSSDEVDLPVRIPAGDYYICKPAGPFGTKRCLTYKEAPVPEEDSSSSDCDGGHDSTDSTDSDPYVEAARYRYVYASNRYASKFTLSYANETTTAFTLACESCKNEHHGALVSIVRRHLELQSADEHKAGVVGEYQAYSADKELKNAFYVKTTQKHFMKWWQVSTFRKRMELGTRLRRVKVQFYPALNGGAVSVDA